MFLESTPKQLTAIQIKSWLDALNSNINSAKSNYNNISNWLTVSSENSDYTQEDFSEVLKELENAVVKIKSLLPTE